MKFEDCTVHGRGSGSELFIVEGDSASASVVNIRNANTQAVLPMQGKPLNALRASGERVAEFPLFKQLAAALGIGLTNLETGEVSDLSTLRFDRVLLLFDPDADGIHCGALMLMYFYRWMRPLLEEGRVLMVRPPLFLLTIASTGQTFHAYSPEHAGKINSELAKRGIYDIKTHHHRGLASIDPPLLRSSCVDPATRRVD
ncbi:MAG: toprim domain-containing protein, partial [Casimicrobium sp.]